jgi:hypothetical protein
MNLQDRIAICFSGQIRTGVENSPNLLEYIGDMRDAVDIFIHTWDIETESPWTEENKGDLNIATIRRYVDREVFTKIRDIYNPLDIRIDNFDFYQRSHYNRIIARGKPVVAQIPMFQTIWESNQLKLAHETLCNSKYGAVLRTRFDVNFGKGRSLIEDLQYAANKKDLFYFVDFGNKFPEAIEDVCWLSSSKIMDRVCNFILDRETNPTMNHIDWQQHMSKYLVEEGIHARPFKNNNLTIVRNKFITENGGKEI